MKIVITGGSGFIGKALTQKFEHENHEVKWLTRNVNKRNQTDFYWSPNEQKIDPESINWADVVIHLAGASVAGKRWSKAYKKEIYDSRIQSSKLLVSAINNSSNPPKKLISASATGYYGAFKGPHTPFVETDGPGNDFLAKVTADWEHEIFQATNTITSAIRIGFVLAKEGGALGQLVTPIKYGVGAPIGSGKQIMSWIHLDDLIGIFEHLIENDSPNEVVNGVAPNWVSNEEMTKQIAKRLKRPLLLPNVPEFALTILLGEFASFAYKGTAVSSNKLESVSFHFKYPTLSKALDELLA